MWIALRFVTRAWRRARAGRRSPRPCRWRVGRASSVAAPDAFARRRDGVPPGAEGADTLTLGVAWLGVLAEAVERMAVVGHLRAPVAALARPEQCLASRAGRRRL